MALKSLQQAKPLLESWLGIQRSSPLPVIMTSVNAGASFYNFITDAIELQTLGTGENRDLYWHEYVHQVMFQHLQNFLGPAGSILHVLWMPAWYIEGLAEALSVSIGSYRQAGIERYHALSGQWPSYDRLHSLYGKGGNFFLEGYGTSGGFVAWMLRDRKQNNGDLKHFLQDFFHYTLPYYYPLAFNPLSDFLPFDAALKKRSGETGRELYERYKKEATQYWTVHSQGALLSEHLKPSPASKQEKPEYQSQLQLSQILVIDQKNIGIRSDYILNGTAHNRIVTWDSHSPEESDLQTLIERKGVITELFVSEEKLVWHEHEFDDTRLCYILKKDLTIPVLSENVHCPLSAKLPLYIEVLGAKKNATGIDSLWVAKKEQTLSSVYSQVMIWNPKDASLVPSALDIYPSEPIKIAYAREQAWLLIGEKSHTSLVKLDNDGSCMGVMRFNDLITHIESTQSDSLSLTLFQGLQSTRRELAAEQIKLSSCKHLSGHQSPLLYALRKKEPGSFEQILAATSTWSEPLESIPTEPNLNIPEQRLIDDTSKTPTQSSSAHWRARPVFAIPWIGADDALSYQYGIMSVPLMDHLQNETVQAAFLYGPESHYPNTEISLVSTRFWPTLNASVFRRQVWNGSYRLSADGNIYSSYYDEKGLRLSAALPLYFQTSSFSLSSGVLFSQKQRYLGPFAIVEGQLIEPFIRLSWNRTLKPYHLSLNLNARATPSQLNKNFEYNQLSFESELNRNFAWLSSNLSLGLKGSRIRGVGRKTPLLREVYSPVRTYIAGGGGGYNQNSFPLVGPSALFSNRHGDTQARLQANYGFPLIKDMEKLFWILYLEKLSVSNFLLYGGAWYQGAPIKEKLSVSYGHSIDLTFENKGVHFNMGFGLGRLLPYAYDSYISAGFDALF